MAQRELRGPHESDVVSLGALYLHLAGFLEDPLERPLPENLDIYAAARLFEDLGSSELALRLYENSRKERLPGEYHRNSLYRHARIHIREKQFDSAIKLLLIASKENDLESTIELAKLYEHAVIDIKKSIKFTEKGIKLIDRSDLPEYKKKSKVLELERRLQRLDKKLSKR